MPGKKKDAENKQTIIEERGRGGLRPNPQPPSGEWKDWESPKGESTPVNRRKGNGVNEQKIKSNDN